MTTIVSAKSRRYPHRVFHFITTISMEELVDSCHRETKTPRTFTTPRWIKQISTPLTPLYHCSLSMAPIEVNPSNYQGGGNKGPPPKKQAQLGFSQGKAGSALKASKKKQCLNTPGQGKARAGGEDNGGGGGTSTGNMDKGLEFTTPRRGSSLPPSCGWAEARTCLHEGENAANIQGNNREGGEVTTNNGEESPPQGTRLNCNFSMLSTESTLLPQAHSLTSKKGTSPNWVRHMIYTRERTSSSSSSSCMGAGLTIPLLIGDLPVKAMVEKAVSKGVRQVNYATFQSITYRKLSPAEAFYTPTPGTAAVSHVLGPPAIQWDAEMPDTEEMVTGTIRWSNLKSKKRKDPTVTPDQLALVAGSKVIRPRGVLDLACLTK